MAEHPGKIVKAWMESYGVDAQTVARAVGVSSVRIRDIANCGRAVSTDTSLRLGVYFGAPGSFLAIQQLRFDMEIQRERIAEDLEDIEPLELGVPK